MVAAAGHPMTATEHAYASTACAHHRHDECRLACKFCTAPCMCSCHQTSGQPQTWREQFVDVLHDIADSYIADPEQRQALIVDVLDGLDCVPSVVLTEDDFDGLAVIIGEVRKVPHRDLHDLASEIIRRLIAAREAGDGS